MTDADRFILLVIAISTVVNGVVLWMLWHGDHRG